MHYGAGAGGPGGAGLVLVRVIWNKRSSIVKMGLISVYIVNKAGGLIFSHDQPTTTAEVETSFNYPLGMVLEEVDRNVVVKFGEKLGIQGEALNLSEV